MKHLLELLVSVGTQNAVRLQGYSDGEQIRQPSVSLLDSAVTELDTGLQPVGHSVQLASNCAWGVGPQAPKEFETYFYDCAGGTRVIGVSLYLCLLLYLSP